MFLRLLDALVEVRSFCYLNDSAYLLCCMFVRVLAAGERRDGRTGAGGCYQDAHGPSARRSAVAIQWRQWPRRAVRSNV